MFTITHAIHLVSATGETWWSIFTDPNHIVAELLWTIIQDGVLGWFLYGLIFKKIMLPRLHAKFDKEHAISHEDGHED